jgi:molybdenum cofactor guanylyltransferase
MYAMQNITGLILAGGRGSRMGGADKGLQRLHGTPLAAHVLARLAPQVRTVLISANRNAHTYAELAPVIADSVGGFAGPIAGILAGLGACQTPLLLAVACDVPRLPADLAAKLLQAKQAAHAPASFAVAGAQAHPACCLLDVATLPALQRMFDAGQRRLYKALLNIGAVPCDFSAQAQAFANINDLDALALLEQTTPAV